MISIYSQSPVVIETNQEQYSLNKHLHVYEDKDSRLDIKEISSESFHSKWTKLNKVPNFGFTKSTYWAKFTLQNNHGKENVLLEISYPLLDDITLFVFNDGQLIDTQKSGDTLPFKDRKISHRNIVFELDLTKENTVYLRIKSDSSMQFPMTIWTKNQFTNNVNHEHLLWGIYFGIILIMVLYNLFIYISTKDKNYLFYVIYISAAILTQSTLYGFASYIWTDSPKWLNISLPLFLNLDLFFGTIFCISFLDTKVNTPKTHKVILVVLTLIGISSTLIFWTGYATAMKITMLLLILLPIVLITAGVNTLRAGIKTARFFLLAWIALLFGLILTSLDASGKIPSNFFTSYSIQIGTTLEVILLSLALADRINTMKKEREEALKQKLEESEKVARMSKAFQRFVPLKFLGDAIMALFDRSSDDAVKSAIMQMDTLKTYNANRIKSGYQPIKIGIGINSGPLMLGTIGSANRMDGTVISDAVNLASRLEGLTQKYSLPVLISDNSYNLLINPNQFQTRVIDKVRVKGKAKSKSIVVNTQSNMEFQKTSMESLILKQNKNLSVL